MFQFLQKLYASWTRQAVAADQAAEAMEGIAADLASFRERLRSGLGLDAEAPAGPAPAATKDGHKANGQTRRLVGKE